MYRPSGDGRLRRTNESAETCPLDEQRRDRVRILREHTFLLPHGWLLRAAHRKIIGCLLAGENRVELRMKYSARAVCPRPQS
jgi:hypothetical protein